MTPFQQLYLGLGASKKTYLDDVFSTQAYIGTGSNRSFVNGLDLSSEGGLVWTKNRSGSSNMHHMLFDTERGVTKDLVPSTSGAEGTSTTMVTAFNTDGYSLGSSGYVNENNSTFASWSFRKAEGFCDIVTWTGNGSNRTIAHSLGSIPGMIIIKNLTDSGEQWVVGHRGIYASSPWNYYMWLNTTNAQIDDGQIFNDTAPTSSVFSIGTQDRVNKNGSNYIAYIFAGGESTAATARSVDFDGDDYLSLPVDSDLDLGNSDFTFEAWFKPDTNNSNQYIFNTNNNGLQVYWTADKVIVYGYDGSSWFINGEQSPDSAKRGLWNHVAVTRSNNVFRCFLNGNVFYEATHNNTFVSLTTSPTIGRYSESNLYFFYGKISNLRLVKGTAVYTSSFRPPTEPLTNITNTKLLCCNNSSTTGSTVTPGTITANGNPTASSDSPFDDPAGFVFGDSKEGIIKCGSYIGNATTGLEVNVGFEPQWVLIKDANAATSWRLLDSMRGITTGGHEKELFPDGNFDESSADRVSLTSTGFIVTSSSTGYNVSGNNYIYTAIRRPDGYVGKPAEAGTDVFAMDTGNSSTTIPAFDSGFPVDFGIKKSPASTGDWLITTRLTGLQVLKTNSTGAESTSTTFTYDSNVGYAKSQDAVDQGWMWKRHAGFESQAYTGVSGTQYRAHQMGVTPEMIWVKARTGSNEPWCIGHKDLTGGFTSHHLRFDTSGEYSSDQFAVAPTSTHWSTASGGLTNNNGGAYIAMLFASVSGVSSVGSYSGNNSSSGPTVTTGFSPRFILIKRANGVDNWFVFDTVRGISNSGNDARLKLDESGAQTTSADWLSISSTGFTLNTSDTGVNASSNYIYYAHA